MGEHLLGLYLVLEPFAEGAALQQLHPDLRPDASALGITSGTSSIGADSTMPTSAGNLELEPEREHVVVWMEAVAHQTAALLLQKISTLPALSQWGAKQLAADVSYLGNIFFAGLSLPRQQAFAELESLLVCELDVLRAAAAQVTTLPPSIAEVVVAKRGGA